MYNCVIIRVNNRPVMVMHTIDQAENMRRLMQRENMPWHGVQVNIDWAYIEGLPF